MMTGKKHASTRAVLSLLSISIFRIIRGLCRDRSGAAAVELALLLPIMIGLYIGGIETSDGFAIKRKVTSVSSALADLVSRTKIVKNAEMQNILDAAEAIIAPYFGIALKMKVSGVWIDENDVARVVWGTARNDTAETENAIIKVPDGVSKTETFLVVTEVHYTYKPVIGYAITGDVDISYKTHMKPRLSKTVCLDDKCQLNDSSGF